MMGDQEAEKIFNIEHVENMIVHGVKSSSSSLFKSPQDELRALIDVAYDYTAKYRKLLNSNNRTEKDEMSIFEGLHASVQDLYFFYEKNAKKEECAEADIALTIVDVYNKFFGHFKGLIEAKKAGKNFTEEVNQANRYLNMLVKILLANMNDTGSTSKSIQGPRYITDERKSRYILTKEQDQDAEFEFFPDKFYIMTFYYITLHDGKDYYVLLDHGSYPPNSTRINDFWSIPRSVTIINGPRVKTVGEILSIYDEELEKSSMKEKLDMQETDFYYNYGLFNRKKEIVSCHVEYKRSVTEPEKMRCYYIRNIFVSGIDSVGIRNLVDPECRHNHTFLPLSIINNLPRINGSGDEAPEHGWYSFMGRPIPENIMDVFIKERENLINKSVKIKESDLFRHSQGVLFHVAISNAHEFFMSSADRSIIDRQIAGIYEEVMMRHNIMHHAVDHYQVIGAIRADGGVDFTQLLEEMFEKFSRLVYRRHTYLLLRCTVIFGQYEFGKTYGLCSSIPGFSGKAYERLKIMAHQTHNVQMEFGYEMNGILFGYSLDDSDNVKFDPLGVQKCSQGRNISYGMRFLIKKYL